MKSLRDLKKLENDTIYLKESQKRRDFDNLLGPFKNSLIELDANGGKWYQMKSTALVSL